MGRRIGAKGQMVFLSLIPQSVQDDAGLNSGHSPVRVELKNFVHVLGEIQHHRDIAALPGQTRAAPRGSTGAPYFLHAATAAITSSSSRGTTNPIGICR